MTAMLKLRERAGISAKELSLRTGIPVEVIIRAELGLIKLHPQQRKKIVRALR